MYRIEVEKQNEHSYVYKAKNKHNQLLNLEIYEDINNNWSVCFFITTKRKRGFQKLQQTGKDGLSSLIWAKNCVIDWISMMKRTSLKTGNIKLCVYADDKRRMTAYKRGLLPLGFKVEKSKDSPLYMII